MKMKNKIKTHKASSKRFKITKNKKVMHQHQGDNAHLKVNKSSSQKQNKKGRGNLASSKESRKIIRLIAK